MAEHNKDTVSEPRPLRTMLHSRDLSADDRLLGRAFSRMHEADPQGSAGTGIAGTAEGWAALEDRALRTARRRRWRYHLGEAWRGLGTMQLLLGAAAAVALVLLGAQGVRSLSSGRGRMVAGRTVDSGRGGVQGGGRGSVVPDERPRIDLLAQVDARSVTLHCGALLELAQGQAAVDQQQPQRPTIRLQRGRVAVQVPPLPVGGQLMVTTGDADVIVHGTRFVVQRSEQDDATSVSVQEGLVEVRPRGGHRPVVFLRAGEQVQVQSSASYMQGLSAQVTALIAGGRCDDKASAIIDAYLIAAGHGGDGGNGTDVSDALYQKGSCAAAKGDLQTALSAFQQVETTTRSELRADNALARIAQLHAQNSMAEGANAWRRYLQKFPQGQHRGSAQRYLQEAAGHR